MLYVKSTILRQNPHIEVLMCGDFDPESVFLSFADSTYC